MFIAMCAFDSACELIEQLRRWIRTLPIGSSDKERATVHKLDEISDWKEWSYGHIGGNTSGIFGRNASHYFCFVLREGLAENLGTQSNMLCHIDEVNPDLPNHGDDVMLSLIHI